jgi:formate transporter
MNTTRESGANSTTSLERQLNIDALLPPEMASKASRLGVTKATMGWKNMFMLSILAGAFISLGAIFATIVTTGGQGSFPFGFTRLLGGLVFSLGLILVVIAGAELFTGNNLIVMAWAEHTISSRAVLRNWGIVYAGNFAGTMATAIIIYFTRQYTFAGGAVGANILNIAAAKCSLGFIQAVTLGIFCNALVCLAVWLCYSARSTTDKILSIIFPITAFVSSGFEHSVANMYFISIGLLVKKFAGNEFWASIGKSSADYANLTWANFLLGNLLPVTIGNIIGGSIMVGIVYWFIYIRKPNASPFQKT